MIVVKLCPPVSLAGFLLVFIAEALGYAYYTPDGVIIFPVVSVKIFLPILCAANLALYLQVRRFAFQIEFNEAEKKIIIIPFYGKATTLNYGELEQIIINWYTAFCFSNAFKVNENE